MFRRTSYSRIGLFLIITILFFMNQFNFLAFTYASPVAGSSSNDPSVILFDQGHGQFFNASTGRFSQAIEALQLNNNTIVKFSNSRLNTSILSGVDVLIITNPKSGTEYSESEEDAIQTWFNRGNKGLFLLSNPYLEDNATLSGNSLELKKLITGQYLSIADIDLRRDIVKLDSPSTEDDSILFLDTDYSDHLIFNQTALVNKTITQSCSVRAPERVLIAGREAYAEDSAGAITLQRTTPEIIR